MKAITFPHGAPRKILLCQLRQIGDVLLMTPSAHLLAERWPDAEIHVLTEKKCAPVLAHNPHVAKVWAIDKKAFTGPFAFLKELGFYRQVAAEDFDLVVDFQQLPRCRWVVLLSRRAVRLSYTPNWYNRWLYSHTVTPKGGYAAMTKASVLAPLGLDWDGQRPLMQVTDIERVWAAHYLTSLGITPEHTLITVDPSHRRHTRRWPAQHFGELIRLAAAQDPSLRFLLLYGPGEEADAQAVAEASHTPEACIVPERVLTLREMGAVLAAAHLHLGNCSAPRHMAVAVGTPTFVILGATSQAWTFPAPEHKALAKNLDCQPCNSNDCDRNCACLTDLAPADVLDEFMGMVRR